MGGDSNASVQRPLDRAPTNCYQHMMRARELLGDRGVSAVAVSVAWVLAACSSSGGPSCGPVADGAADSGAEVPLTASAFCEQERAQTASFNARCLGGAEADWKALRDGYLPCAKFDDLVSRGTLRYHPELAEACLKANGAQRDCAAPENFCFTQTLEGLIPEGGACANDYECPGNAGCWAPGEYGANACGENTCVAVGNKVGDSCAALGFCYAGVVTCLGGTCVAYGAAGEPCGPGLADCALGLRCDSATATCVVTAAGSPCTTALECLGAQRCAKGSCVARLAIGEPCGDAPDGCVGFAACDPDTLTCVAAGHVGQPCGAMTGSAILCIGGSCFDNGDGTSSCRQLFADGQACSIGAQCVSGGCDFDNTCAVCN
jgi:hypothetical protein